MKFNCKIQLQKSIAKVNDKIQLQNLNVNDKSQILMSIAKVNLRTSNNKKNQNNNG